MPDGTKPERRSQSQFPPLTGPEFAEIVEPSELPVVVYFTATCCKLSSISRREFAVVAEELKDRIAFFEVDARSEKELVSRLDVKAVPTLLIFVTGIERAALLGFYERKELRKRLLSIISTEEDGLTVPSDER